MTEPRPESIDLHRAMQYLSAVQGGRPVTKLERSPDTTRRYLSLLSTWGWVQREGRTYTLTDQGRDALKHLKKVHALVP